MDNSEKQLLEQNICQTLLDSELDAFIVADENAKIVFWNAAAESMFGHPREHALGKDLHDVIAPENVRERAKAAFVHFRETGGGPLINSVVEMEALHRSGQNFFVEISLSATSIDGSRYAQAIIKRIDRRKEIEAEMQRLSTTDPLTGLFNRENMFAHGKRELSRAVRYGNSLSLVLLDIDQLKEINEVSGHFAGDRVIKTLADFLKETCRRSDVIGRLSGKELLLLLPETELKMAMIVAEKWLEAISQLKVNLDRDNSIAFNCSIGVTSASKEEQFEVLLKKVESNLQTAKAAGGNQVACEEQE